jgi:hypothetical protein
MMYLKRKMRRSISAALAAAMTVGKCPGSTGSPDRGRYAGGKEHCGDGKLSGGAESF